MSRTRAILLIGATVFVALAARLYNLDTVPGEWYGDISIVHRYVAEILAPRWPFYYALSAGPLYHYLIAPVIGVLGHTYLSYKLASVMVSLLAIGAMMLLGHEIGGFRLSLATGFLSAVSSWFLVFSRLGNSQIAIPLLTALMAYFLVRFIKTGRSRDATLGAVVSMLGLYSYPQTYILPLICLLILAGHVWSTRGKAPRPREAWVSLLGRLAVIAIMALPFLVIVQYQPDNFRTGYVGGKLLGSGQVAAQDFALALGSNLWTTLQMLHLRGDILFRSNPPSLPHLDALSGILMIIGLAEFLAGEKRRYAPLFFMSILTLIVPASWPFLPAAEIPSASRTIGIVPFIYLLTANGLLWVIGLIRGNEVIHGKDDAEKRAGPPATAAISGAPGRRGRDESLGARRARKTAAQAALAAAIALIVVLNFQRYFVSYAWNLPNHNVAYGRSIAAEIDKLPEGTAVYVGGCCWGAWGQPEPDGIRYQLRDPRRVTIIDLPNLPLDELRSNRSPKHFFWDPRDEDKGFAELRRALPEGEVEKRVDEHGGVVYLRYMVR